MDAKAGGAASLTLHAASDASSLEGHHWAACIWLCMQLHKLPSYSHIALACNHHGSSVPLAEQKKGCVSTWPALLLTVSHPQRGPAPTMAAPF